MSQLNFFLTQDEILERLNLLLLSDEFLVFNGKFFESKNPLPIHKLSELKIFESLTIWVTNKFLTPICSQKGTRDYLNAYLFDTFNDPIIEPDNCIMFDLRMSPGRLFYKAGWIKNSDLRLLHKKRANKIIRIFRKDLKPISFYKISDAVIDLVNNGYELELGRDGKVVNKDNFNGT